LTYAFDLFTFVLLLPHYHQLISMEPVSVLYIAFASISLFVCFLQLFLSFAKKNNILTLISLILSFVVFIRYSVIIFCSDPLGVADHHLTLLRCQLLLTQAVFICMLGVLFYFTEHTRKLIILAQVSIIGILMLLSLFIPDRLFFGTNESIYLRDLPGGDISIISKGFTWWRIITDLTVLFFAFSAIFLIVKKIDSIKYKTILIFFIGIGLILLTGLYDQMVELDRINSVYLLPFAVFLFYMILNFIPYVFLLKDVFENSIIYEEEKKWRKLVDEAAVVVVELNRMGNVVFINPYFYELTGYKEDEVIGKDWFEFFIPKEQHYELQSAFIEILEFEFHPHYLNPILTKNKEEKMIHWFNVRNRDKNGTITGSLSIGVDMTEDYSQKEEFVKKLAEAEAMIGKLKTRVKKS